MKNYKKYIVLIILLLCCFLGISFFFKQQFNIQAANKYLTSTIGSEAKISGDVIPSIFPWPQVIIKNAHISNNGSTLLNVKLLKAKLPISSIFSKELSINSLTLKKGEIYSNEFKSIKLNKLKIPKLLFKDIINKQNDLSSTVAISGELLLKKEKNSVNITTSWKGNKYHLNAIQNNKNKETTVSITTGKSNLKFIGHVNNILESLEGEGTVNGKFNSKDFIKHSKLKNIEFDFQGKVNISETAINISDIKIISDLIENVAANAIISLDEDKDSQIKISADHLNADSILTLKKDTIHNILYNLLSSFDTGDNDLMPIDFNISINKVTLLDDYIQNISFHGHTGSNIDSLLTMSLPGNTETKLLGKFSHNKIRPEFQGNILFKSNNLKALFKWFGLDDQNDQLNVGIIKSDLSIIPYNMKLDNLKILLGDFRAKGEGIIKANSNKITMVHADLETDKLNADKVFVLEEIKSFINELYEADKDKTNARYNKLVNDYKYLRNNDINLTLDFKVKNLEYKDYLYNNIQGSFTSNNKGLELNDFTVQSKDIDLSSNIAISLPTFRPLIKANLDIKHLNLKNIMPNDFTNKKVNFWSSSNYDSQFDISIKGLHLDKNNLAANLAAKLSTKDNTIVLEQFDSKIFDGELHLQGVISSTNSEKPEYAFSYTCNDIKPNYLFKKITGLNDKINGKLSLTGRLNSNGNTYNQIIKNLQGSNKLLGASVKWQGFDMDKVISAVDKGSNISNKKKHVDYYSINGSSTFKDLSGSIIVNKGVASLDNFVIKNDRYTGIFIGKYDLFNKSTNYRTNIQFIPQKETAPLSLNMSGKGIITNIEQQVDSTAIKQHITKKAKANKTKKPILENRKAD